MVIEFIPMERERSTGVWEYVESDPKSIIRCGNMLLLAGVLIFFVLNAVIGALTFIAGVVFIIAGISKYDVSRERTREEYLRKQEMGIKWKDLRLIGNELHYSYYSYSINERTFEHNKRLVHNIFYIDLLHTTHCYLPEMSEVVFYGRIKHVKEFCGREGETMLDFPGKCAVSCKFTPFLPDVLDDFERQITYIDDPYGYEANPFDGAACDVQSPYYGVR